MQIVSSLNRFLSSNKNILVQQIRATIKDGVANVIFTRSNRKAKPCRERYTWWANPIASHHMPPDHFHEYTYENE